MEFCCSNCTKKYLNIEWDFYLEMKHMKIKWGEVIVAFERTILFVVVISTFCQIIIII